MPRKSKLDDLMEAITFAEAGETETARRLASEVFPSERSLGGEAARILAVSGASGFSRKMIEDSIGLAERLGYGIVALNVSPALSKLVAKLSSRTRGGLGRSVDLFRARASDRRIPFVHIARRGDPERAVADVKRAFRRVAFLVIEPDLAPTVRFSGIDVPIFYLAGA